MLTYEQFKEQVTDRGLIILKQLKDDGKFILMDFALDALLQLKSKESYKDLKKDLKYFDMSVQGIKDYIRGATIVNHGLLIDI